MALLTVIDNQFVPRKKSVLVVGQVNANPVTFSVDESWDGLELQAQFFGPDASEPTSVALDESMTCNLPPEATEKPGPVYVALAGYDGDVVIKLTEKLYFADAIIGADKNGGIPPEEQTPSYLNQMVEQATAAANAAKAAKETADNLQASAEAGEFDGDPGPAGPPGKSPIIRNGTWWIWDNDSKDYTDTGVVASGGGGGGTTDYNKLTNRPSIGGILLEGNKTAEQLGLAKASQIPNVPSWAMQPKKPTYTAQEVGAQPQGDYALRSEIPTKLQNPYALTIKGKTYDGSQPVDVEVADGKTPIKGIDYFTEAEIQDVAQQAAALVPGGGGGQWELHKIITLDQDISVIEEDFGFEANAIKITGLCSTTVAANYTATIKGPGGVAGYKNAVINGNSSTGSGHKDRISVTIEPSGIDANEIRTVSKCMLNNTAGNSYFGYFSPRFPATGLTISMSNQSSAFEAGSTVRIEVKKG